MYVCMLILSGIIKETNPHGDKELWYPCVCVWGLWLFHIRHTYFPNLFNLPNGRLTDKSLLIKCINKLISFDERSTSDQIVS